jgi:hypothetical protein
MTASVSENRPYRPGFIGEVRRRTPLAALVGRDVTLRRSGRGWKGCCPFHLEKTPSFYVYPGHYHCFGCGAHGDVFGYAMQRDGLDFGEAVEALARDAGLDLPSSRASRRSDNAAARKRAREIEAQRRTEREAADRARRHAWAAAEVAHTVAIEGERVARNYIRVDRAIPLDAPFPDSLRYDPTHRAIVGIATDTAGRIVGGQRIHLDADGHRLAHDAAIAAGHRAAKQTFGSLAGSAVELPARSTAWTYGADMPVRIITESLEAAASIWQITGQETAAALGAGNLRHAFRRDRCNAIWTDDDQRGSAAWKQARKAIRQARDAGLMVIEVHTHAIRQGDKSDANDLLRTSGPEGPARLRARITAALWPEGKPVGRMSAAAGHALLRQRIGSFVAAAIDHATAKDVGDQQLSDIVQRAIRTDTALGKSTTGRELLADAVRQLRLAGISDPLIIALPRHDLIDEAAAAMREIAPDLEVRAWRGRRQPGMCGDLEGIAAARARSLDPQRFVCGVCPLADGCAYQVQRRLRADVWFVAHDLLVAKPPAALRHAALLWIDETPTAAALIGTGPDDDAPSLPLDVLRRLDPIAGKPDAADRLHDLRGLAHAVAAALPPGAMIAEPFRRAGLTAAMAREAIKLEWSTKLEPDPETGAIEDADRNLDLAARARFWLSLAALLDDHTGAASGWLRIAPDRDGQTVCHMRGRREINAAWRDVPTLLTDASLDLSTARHLWPAMQQTADIAVEAPHQHIRQVDDCSYSLTMLDQLDPRIADHAELPTKERGRRREERGRRRNKLRAVHAILHREARLAAPGLLLAVAQQRIIPQLQAIGAMPVNVQWLHHGAVSGIDVYRQCARIVIVGRQAPAPAAVEAMREALTGTVGERLPHGGWYQRSDAVHLLQDGRLVPCEADRHPDPIADAFRRRIMALELQQIIGRGRGIWRTADNPLHVLVLSDVPLDLPIAEACPAAAVRPSFEDRQMAALAGLAFECAAHASAVHRELWPTPERAQYAARRYSRGQPAGSIAWCYQIAGQGERVWRAWAPPTMPADAVRAALTPLGTLALFERVEMAGSTCKPEKDSNPLGNSTDFDSDRSVKPFAWRAWERWRVEHPPDS